METLASRPLTVGPHTLRNRVVSAPMERNYCAIDGHMTELYRDYLRQRAAAGVALVMTEASFIRADGKGRSHQLGVHADSCIEGLRALADDVHALGALLGCQLNHGGGTVQTAISGLPTVAPSAVGVPVAGGQVPRALETREVYELVDDFAAAARRCVSAGVDVLSIHAGHGYLVHQFMSPLSNHRDDEFADPALFLTLLISAVRDAAPTVALGLRLSAIEGVDGGLDAEQTLAIVERVPLDQLDFLDLSAGSYAAGEWIVQSGEWKPGLLSDYAAAYRRFGKPLGMAGRLNSPEIVEEVLAAGTCDYVSLARALHADPAFATACLDGSPYRPCIACNVCIDNLGVGPVGCSVNPAVGRGSIPIATPRVRPGATVTVLGAGPAGLSSARELALAGATVTVLDTALHLGGRMAAAAEMKSTPDFARFIGWSSDELTRLGVTVELGARATEPGAASDATIIATGGQPTPSKLYGSTTTQLLDADAWVQQRSARARPQAVTIWGSDAVAMSLADTLADEGTRVLLISPEHEIAPRSGRRAKILAVPRLRNNPGVRIRLGVDLTEIGEGRVRVTDSSGGSEWLDAPGPVLACRTASGTIETRMPGRPDSDAVTEYGDTIRDAVLSGYDAAQQMAARLQ